MQTMMPLKPGGYYHIFNRGINRGNIFFEARNYSYFLSLYARYITPVADLYAYSLLPNHFHFLIRIKSSEGLHPVLVSKAHNRLFSSYAKAINKAYARTGSLFQHHFGRIPITSTRYFSALMRYIHHNPQKHGWVADFRDWPYTSFQLFLSHVPTIVKRAEALDWFDGTSRFQKYHRAKGSGKNIRGFLGNDLD
jgi:putative transposase